MTTIPTLLNRNAQQFSELPALTLDGDTLTWAQAQHRIAQIATGLMRFGVGRGDHVAIMMGSRPEHWLADQAAVHAGAAPTTVYSTMPPVQIQFLAAHSRAKVAILEGAGEVERWLPILDQLPDLRHIVVLDPAAAVPGDSRFHSWSEVFDIEADLEAFEASWRAIGEHDPVTLIFTSGTTGVPKGVILTHANVIANADARNAAAPTPDHFTSVCYLPLAHIAERMVSVYMAIHKAGHITFCPDIDQLVPTLAKTRPTSFFGVPRVWEKLAGALRANPALTLENVGLDRVEWACSASAPLPADVQEFFRGRGITILEAWGMTETTGIATSTNEGTFRFGSVGEAIPGNETMLEEDGEILVRGPIVCAGYLQADGSVAPATDADGWLHTGDVGRIDDGHLYVIDRKKELIITSGGKNVAPSALEGLLARHPLVGQSLAFGDRKPYIVALIVLNQETAPTWAAANGVAFDSLADLSTKPEVLAELDRAVATANESLARVEQIKKFAVLPAEWTPATGELTPSMKIRRRNIYDKYAAEIESLYATV